MKAAIFRSEWPSKPDRFRVACYHGNFADSPVIYSPAVAFDHKTLKAAIHRLTHLIYRQGRSGYTGVRYEAMYIVTPAGERLSRDAARERLA